MKRLTPILCMCILAIPMLYFSFQSKPKLSKKKPNIIFILTDDQDTSTLEYMPQLQEHLVHRGTTFENSFVASPICCPSRTSILRGQYVHNHRVFDNSGPNGGFKAFQSHDLSISTVATWLQDSGYKTVLLGKYLNIYPGNFPNNYVPKGWNEWYALSGGNDYFNYRLNENGKITAYGSKPEDYLTTVLANHALNFVQRQNGDPFCMFVCFFAPHTPTTIPPGYIKFRQNLQAPRSMSFNEADINDKPSNIKKLLPLDDESIQKIDKHYCDSVAALSSVDKFIGRLIEVLNSSDKLENTYIFYTTDNGYEAGNHRIFGGKGTPYEETIRFPIIVRGPGVMADSTLPHIVSNIDLAPTFTELAGAKPPEFIDGKSFVCLMGSTPLPLEDWKPDTLVEYSAIKKIRKKNANSPPWIALRTQRYLYTEYSTGERELYDLQKDPFELENKIEEADLALIKTLQTRLQYLSKCAGPSCR